MKLIELSRIERKRNLSRGVPSHLRFSAMPEIKLHSILAEHPARCKEAWTISLLNFVRMGTRKLGPPYLRCWWDSQARPTLLALLVGLASSAHPTCVVGGTRKLGPPYLRCWWDSQARPTLLALLVGLASSAHPTCLVGGTRKLGPPYLRCWWDSQARPTLLALLVGLASSAHPTCRNATEGVPHRASPQYPPVRWRSPAGRQPGARRGTRPATRWYE